MVTSASDGASGSGLHAIDCAEMKESHGREQRIIRKRNSEQEAIQRVRDNFKGSQWDLERTTMKLVDGINLVDRIRRDTKLIRYKKGDIRRATFTRRGASSISSGCASSMVTSPT